MDIDKLSLEEQALLLEEVEASLVFYVDDDGNKDYNINEDDEDDIDDLDEYDSLKQELLEDAKRVNDELKEVFKDKFKTSQWETSPVDAISLVVANDNVKTKENPNSWLNERPFSIGVGNVADPRLPMYNKRRFPDTVLVYNEKKAIIDCKLPPNALTSEIVFSDKAPERVEKLCHNLLRIGTCRFGSMCKFIHKPICKQHQSGKCKRKTCKFIHVGTQPSERKHMPMVQKPRSESFQPTKKLVEKEVDITDKSMADGFMGKHRIIAKPDAIKPIYKPRPLITTKPVTEILTKPISKLEDKKPNTQKKIFLCKFIANNEICKFGDKCSFSHSREELERYMKSCPNGDKCKSVNHTVTTIVKNGQKLVIHRYTNVNNSRCPSKHPGEMTVNYINRLTITQKM